MTDLVKAEEVRAMRLYAALYAMADKTAMGKPCFTVSGRVEESYGIDTRNMYRYYSIETRIHYRGKAYGNVQTFMVLNGAYPIPSFSVQFYRVLRELFNALEV